MSDFIKVAKKSDIQDGKMKSFSVGGKQITIANSEGEFLAFDDSCTHAQCSLAGSTLSGKTVTCYCHGGQFDIKTGEVLAPPPTAPLSIYPVKIDGEDILVEINN